ncbi:MAG TPA: pyruvate kinase, partial [Thermoanaerobaculia bacterium]
ALLLVDDGKVRLKIRSCDKNSAVVEVLEGAKLSDRKGVTLKGAVLAMPAMTEKDHKDLAFALRLGVDWVALSFVQRAEDAAQLKKLVEGRAACLAKIEKPSAIEHLDEILDYCDGLMVARGDLGVEMEPEEVPVAQKIILRAGRRRGAPVIVATQMLESMIEQPRPTRAEATDVANAVFDGADALMLSGETAIGKYPVEVVNTMARIIEEAESYAAQGRASRRPAPYPPGRGPARRTFELDPATHPPDIDLSLEVPDVVSAAAVSAADQLGVSRIVAFSQSGFTARLVARYRPSAPIVAFTPEEEVARRIQLVWGVRPLVTGTEVGTLDEVVQAVERHLLEAKLVAPGERIIILMGHPIRDKPLTNLMRVHRIRSR